MHDIKETIIVPADRETSPVVEITIYPEDFPVLLRQRLQGHSIDEVGSLLGVPAEHVQRLLDGHWRPSKEICRRRGLKTVYAVAGEKILRNPKV